MRAAVVVVLLACVAYAAACASCGGGGGGYHAASYHHHHAPVSYHSHSHSSYSPAPARSSCRPSTGGSSIRKQLCAAKKKMKSLRASLKSTKQEIIRCYGKGAIPRGCGQPKRPPRRRYCNRPSFNIDACALSSMLGGGAQTASVAAYQNPTDLTRGNRNFRDFICRFKQGKINTVGCPFARGGCKKCGDNAPGFGAAFRLAKSSGVGGVAAAPAVAVNPFSALLNRYAGCNSCRRRY